MSYKLVSNNNYINDYNMFKYQNEITTVSNISVEIRFENNYHANNFDMDSDKVQILNRLIEEMKPELFKRLQIDEHINQNIHFERTIKGTLPIGDVKSSHMQYNEKIYIHKNNKFTVDEINKAIENTYPEKFI